MTNEARQIIERARELSAPDREEILEAILPSLRNDVASDTDQAWRDLIDERLAALDRGEEETFDFDAAVDELRRK